MAITEDRKEVYELGYLILPSVAEEDLSKTVKKLKDIVKKVGGVELDGEEPMKIDLAYSMKKSVGARKYVVNDAYISWFKFDLPAEASAKEGAEHPVQIIKKEVDKIEEVLRALLIKTKKETVFTFAEARRKIEEKEQALAEAKEALEAGSDSEDSKVVE